MLEQRVFLLSDLLSAPKVELHVHLDGAVPAHLLFKYLEKYKDDLPETVVTPWNNAELKVRSVLLGCKTVEEMEEILKQKALGLIPMLESFYLFLPVLRGHLDIIEENARLFVEEQAKNNVIYTEVRYSPHELLKQQDEVLSADDVCQAVNRGLAKGIEEHPEVYVKQILCCICFSPQWSEETIDLAIKYRETEDRDVGVVGVDIASGEAHFDDEALFKVHKAAIDRARTAKLPVTIHAGEGSCGWEHVEKAISDDVYGASRIGHGYGAFKRQETMDILKEKRIHCEMCPTSSVYTESFANENDMAATIEKALKNGNPCSLNSDDPVVFSSDIVENISLLAKLFGAESKISDEHHECFVFMQEQAIANSFCTHKLKRLLLANLRKDPFYSEETKKAFGARLQSNTKRILNAADKADSGEMKAEVKSDLVDNNPVDVVDNKSPEDKPLDEVPEQKTDGSAKSLCTIV